MTPPSLQESFMNSEAPVHVLKVNVVIFLSADVPISKPIGSLDLPVSESDVSEPFKIWSFATVIVSILRIFHGVDIH